MSNGNGSFSFTPANAIRVKPEVTIGIDYFGKGGNFNPLSVRGGVEADLVKRPRDTWPKPTIPEEGTPVTFLRDRDYPFDPGAGLPKNVGVVKERQTDLAVRVDHAMRPRQLIETEDLGLPFKPGEGPRYAQKGTEPMDPSVISMSKAHAKPPRRAVFATGSFFSPRQQGKWRPSGMTGIGQLTTLASLALIPIENTIAAITSREQELMRLSSDAFRAATDPYASLRASIDTSYTAMKADPTKVTTEGFAFASAAATYKSILDATLKRVKAALKPAAKPKAKAKKAVPKIVAALPKAVVETVKTPYGMIVLGVGGALIVGLLIARAFSKKGA